MDRNPKSFNSVKSSIKYKPLVGVVDSEKVELNGDAGEDNETESLLPSRRGGLSRHTARPSLRVQWNDKDGDKLAEIREFQPSDVSESDEDEDTDSCICVIM